ncbi:MAG TPA: hypothetical protein VIL55_11310 [Naasia sp.]|jgi:hypothetical protein
MDDHADYSPGDPVSAFQHPPTGIDRADIIAWKRAKDRDRIRSGLLLAAASLFGLTAVCALIFAVLPAGR